MRLKKAVEIMKRRSDYLNQKIQRKERIDNGYDKAEIAAIKKLIKEATSNSRPYEPLVLSSEY